MMSLFKVNEWSFFCKKNVIPLPVLFLLMLQNSEALASVSLPPTLFPPDAASDCKLQFVAFRTGSFFPVSTNSNRNSEQFHKRTVNTPVIFVGLGEKTPKKKSKRLVSSLSVKSTT